MAMATSHVIYPNLTYLAISKDTPMKSLHHTPHHPLYTLLVQNIGRIIW